MAKEDKQDQVALADGAVVEVTPATEPQIPLEDSQRPMFVYDTLGAEHADLVKFASKEDARPQITGLNLCDGMIAVTNGGILVELSMQKWSSTDLPLIEGMSEPLPEGRSVIMPVEALAKALKLTGKKGSLPVCQRVIVSLEPGTEVNGDEGEETPGRLTIPGSSAPTKLKLSATNLEQSGTVEVRPIAGKFPSYGNMIPQADEMDTPPELKTVEEIIQDAAAKAKDANPVVEKALLALLPKVRKIKTRKRTKVALDCDWLAKLAVLAKKFGATYIMLYVNKESDTEPVLLKFKSAADPERTGVAMFAPVRVYDAS